MDEEKAKLSPSAWRRYSPDTVASVSICTEWPRGVTTLPRVWRSRDTAQHTLKACPRWSLQPYTLVANLWGVDLSLSSVILSMLGSDRAWATVASYSETVMLLKMAAERDRENEPGAVPLRSKQPHPQQDSEVLSCDLNLSTHHKWRKKGPNEDNNTNFAQNHKHKAN